MKMSQKNKAVYVGVDDGHYAVKIVTEDGQMYTVPSRAKAGKHLISLSTAGSSASDGGIYTTEEDQTFTVSSHLSEPDDTRFRDYPKSMLNRVLVHHGLRVAGYSGKDVNIATGLPVSYYYNGGSANDDLIQAKVKNLSKGVSADDGDSARIVTNFVTTEAIAAYFNEMIGMDGQPTEIAAQIERSTVGVIDVGGKTTDCAVILPGGTQVDTARSGSSDVGVLTLNDRIEAALRAKFDFDRVPPTMVESAVSSGVVKVYGKEQSVLDIVNAEKEKLAAQIMSTVRAKIGSGMDLDFILLVGGGTIVLREQLTRHFPNCRIPEHAEYANAMGMLKIAKYVIGQG